MMRFRHVAVALLLSSLVTIAPASAQLPTAAIRGTIADAQGAVVPGVTVTINHTGTGLVRTTVTNEVRCVPGSPVCRAASTNWSRSSRAFSNGRLLSTSC